MTEEQTQEPLQTASIEYESVVRESAGRLSIPINWTQDSGLPILLANHAFVRLQDDCFIVTFGQIELPREIDLSEETKERLESEGIPVQIVSRLAITPARMRIIIESFSRLYEIWERQQSGGSGESSAQ